MWPDVTSFIIYIKFVFDIGYMTLLAGPERHPAPRNLDFVLHYLVRNEHVFSRNKLFLTHYLKVIILLKYINYVRLTSKVCHCKLSIP